ncbi:altered inheritance of mitochondria protein 21 [Whalleya microplaca]|nr:altered inheritance of mitochondria protein 21 [Whalleya microplaca]
MSAATMQSTPAIPPRPSRSQEKENGSTGAPSIPPRPAKTRFNRSISPNPDRFAPSPLNEGTFPPKSPNATRLSPSHQHSRLGEELERSKSVELPGVGEEGVEYAAAIEELSSSPEKSSQQSGSAEQTRTVGEDVKLLAPKPTMPAQSARERVAAVTRTDSEKAAAFGIGRPHTEEQPLHSARSLKKKASTTSQLSQHSEPYAEDEHGIPEIGQRVPMLLNAGDVQAPSPAPQRSTSTDGTAPVKNHHRKVSSRSNFGNLPPDSYGLRSHGVASTDKLEKAYYEKRPDLLQKESYNLHDRVRDYRMSSNDLNKIVRDTASHGAGFGTSTGYVGTPSEQVGFQATDEYAARVSFSRPPSTAPKDGAASPDAAADDNKVTSDDDNIIHVDEPERRKGFVKFGDEESAVGADVEEGHTHPILASDEVAKDPSPYELKPAVEPPTERRNEYEREGSRSRPNSRPASIYSPPPPEIRSTPLDDVEEYEPLFPEDEKSDKKSAEQEAKLKEYRQRFPSRDIWEDAPSSVHSTAEVSTPEPSGGRSKEQAVVMDIPPREGETPAQAFARRQEELAEKEGISVDAFLHRQQKAPSWVGHQAHLSKEVHGRPNMAQRFPSRDVWEDTPDSLQFTTTVSTPQSAEESSPVEESKPAAEQAGPKPPTPQRPKKQGSGDDVTSKPTIPGRPKPQIPARPSKPAAESSKEPQPAPKQKPAVPARPAGGKIAALQAGFMSDLNKRLKLGPQAPKKEEETTAPAPSEEKEKAPLSDARKGRARGPQRRAPTKTASAAGSAPPPASNGKPLLSFSTARTLWSIDEEGTMTVDGFGPETPTEAEPKTEEAKTEETKEVKEQVDIEEPKKGVLSEKSESESESKPKTPELESKSSETKPVEAAIEPATEETKTLATNTAGESILEETIEKKESGDQVEKVEGAKDEVGA